MCRLMAYMGPKVLVADVVLWPDRSIMKQSYDAKERQNNAHPAHLAYGNLNGDGFGIGWYSPDGEGTAEVKEDPTPCVFTSVTPAWNNENLGRLSSKIVSPLVFAHVRAAMPGMPVSEQNCHPFQWGRYMWMHNGLVAGFMQVRRALLGILSDAAYDTVQSFHSDSAVCFSVFLHHLPDLTSLQPPQVVLQALEATIASVREAQEAAGITATSLLNFCVSDGRTLVATRYVSHEGEEAASLYYAEGSEFQRCPGPNPKDKGPWGSATTNNSSVSGEGEYCLVHADVGTRVAIIASEPITKALGDWVPVPRNTALVLSWEKHGYINVIHSPLENLGNQVARSTEQEEVARCLEAISAASQVVGRPWMLSLQPQDNGVKLEVMGRSASTSTYGLLHNQEPSWSDVVSSEEHRLTGHRGAVLCLALHQDQFLFSSSTDLTIKVWDLEACKCVRTLTGHNHPIQCLAIHGNFLYSTAGRRLRIWDLRTYTCVRVLTVKKAAGAFCGLAVEADGDVYVAGQDTQVRGFKLSTLWPGPHPSDGAVSLQPPPVATLPDVQSDAGNGHCSTIHTLAVCAGLVATAGGDAMIRIWRTGSLEYVRTLRGHRGSVMTLYASGNLLLSGGRDNVIRVWDLDALVCRRVLKGHKDDVLSIQGLGWTPPAGPALHDEPSADDMPPPSPGPEGEGDSLYASASADGSVRLWSGYQWNCLRIISCGLDPTNQPFLSVALSSKYAVTGSPDGVVRLWPAQDVVARARGTTSNCMASPSNMSTGSQSRAPTPGVDGPPAKRHKASQAAGESGRRCLDLELERSLRDFVRLRTVSSDPSLKEECFRGAKFLASLLESLGAEIKLCRPVEDKNPVVIGRLGRREDCPTITFYGHYDVQPAMEREWASDPFEVQSKDGYFFGRGTSDNKGPVLAFIYAAKELIQDAASASKGPPCNLAFVFEGEEENGSAGFKEALQSNLHWFEGTQLIVISNTLWVGENVPCLTYGMRGMIAASIEVKGPARDLHSGNDGGVFNEPLSDLTKVLASLVDSRNNILIPGFFQGVRGDTLDLALQRLNGSPEFSLQGYRETLGVPSLVKAVSTSDLLKVRWCEPTLSVCDVRVGDEDEGAADPHYRFGPTRFSVIPRLAIGNVSVRFVPDQSAEDLITKMRTHIGSEFAKLGSSNTVSLRVKSVGDWWEADPHSKLFLLAEKVLEREWGTRPLLVREGGTMPVASTLEKVLGAPALLVPFGQSSDNCHLANERLQRINLLHGKNIIRDLLVEVGAMYAAATD